MSYSDSDSDSSYDDDHEVEDEFERLTQRGLQPPALQQPPGTSALKKKKKILPPIDLATFFLKGCHICPKKIRAANIRYILKHPPNFKLNLGSKSDIPGYVKFAPDDPPIFRIPERLRVRIFKYIPVYERLNSLQLVCQRIRKEIRLRVGIRSLLHENTRNGETFFRDVIVESVVVGTYKTPYMSPRNLMIHPRNVKEIFFVAPICIQHFDAFLGRCRKIEKLFIRNHVLDKLAPPTPTRKEGCDIEWRVHQTILQLPPPLRRLRIIKIDLSGPPKRSLMSLHNMLVMLFPKFLRRLSIRVDGGLNMDHTTSVHFMVVSFIQQFQHLTHLLVSTDQDDAFEWREYEFLGFPRNFLVSLGHSRQLREIILTETSVSFHTWNLILLLQRRLEVFQVLHLMELAIPEAIIQKNENTLRKVAIHVILWITPQQHCPLDLGMFRKCLLLEELYICTGAPLSPGVSDVRNFHKLPSSLQALLLKNCTFQANDLAKIVKKLPNLHTLGILSNCAWKDFGVKTGTVRKFLRMRRLNELFVSHCQVIDVKGQPFCNKRKFNDAMKLIGAKQFGQPGVIYFHGNECRWSQDNTGEYVCSILTEWG